MQRAAGYVKSGKEAEGPEEEEEAPPDFALVLPVEEVLPAGPLGHHELQGRLAGGPREAAQELQEGLQLGVHQVGEHHDQGLGGQEDAGFRDSGSRAGDRGPRGRFLASVTGAGAVLPA